MLTVKYSDLANYTLYSVADYLDNINTIGSGEKWVTRFHNKVKKYAEPIKYACADIKSIPNLVLVVSQ